MIHEEGRLHEQELARRAASGDRAAAEQLLGLLYDQIAAVCRRICIHDAEDATQEALISIARALPRFDGRAAVRTWAYRIATNAALDELRRRGRRPSPSESIEETPPRDHEPAPTDRVVDRLVIDDALEQLAPEFRAAVVLRDVMGLEYADIAETLGVPVGTVRSRIARGRRQLVDLLDLGNRSATTGVERDEA